MLFERSGNCRALANRLTNFQDDLAERRVFLLLTETIERLWNGNARTEHGSHFAGKGSDLFSFDSDSKSNFGARLLLFFDCGTVRWSAVARSRHTSLEVGGKKAAFSQQMQRGLAVLRFNDAFDLRASSLDGLITKRSHSAPSPEQTRTISSRLVVPSAALRSASCCIVSIVLTAAALISSLDRRCKMSSRNSESITSSSKMPMRPR